MSDIWFFLKTFVLTVAIVIAMQIQVGGRSIENHALSWVQSSVVASPLNGVAQGAAKMIRDAATAVKKKVKHPFRGQP